MTPDLALLRKECECRGERLSELLDIPAYSRCPSCLEWDRCKEELIAARAILSKRGKFSGCGCCGAELMHDNQLWCGRCIPHIAKGRPLWEQTYLAQFGKDCPYQRPVRAKRKK